MASAAKVYCGNRELSHELAPLVRTSSSCSAPMHLLNPQRFSEPGVGVHLRDGAQDPRAVVPAAPRPARGDGEELLGVRVDCAARASFDGSFVVRFEELQALFNGQVYFMGYLSDTAVFNHLVDCTFLAAFFEKGPSREQHDGERRDGMWLRGDHQPRRAFAGRPRSPDQRHRHQQVREAP